MAHPEAETSQQRTVYPQRELGAAYPLTGYSDRAASARQPLCSHEQQALRFVDLVQGEAVLVPYPDQPHCRAHARGQPIVPTPWDSVTEVCGRFADLAFQGKGQSTLRRWAEVFECRA